MQKRASDKLEEGLARARAAVRKAAASIGNVSEIIDSASNNIISPAIYRNPAAFLQ